MSTTIRVSDETRRRVAAIAEATGRPMTEVVDQAVDALERKVFFEQLNARFAQLRGDEARWEEMSRERRLEESVLRDASSQVPDARSSRRRSRRKG